MLEHRQDKPRTARPNRMTESNRTTVDIQNIPVNKAGISFITKLARKLTGIQRLKNRQDLHGKGFVDFDSLYLFKIHSDFFKDFRNRVRRTNAHPGGLDPGKREGF